MTDTPPAVIRERNQAAFRQLAALGYIRQLPDGMSNSRLTEFYYQFGDPGRRILWNTFDHVLSVEADKNGRWKEEGRLPLADFAAGELPAAFRGAISETMRQAAFKLSDLASGYRYYFKSPPVENAEQILYTLKKTCLSRVRVAPGVDDALLVFEERQLEDKWRQVHRTTASAFLKPDYRHDVDMTAILQEQSMPPVAREGLLMRAFRTIAQHAY